MKQKIEQTTTTTPTTKVKSSKNEFLQRECEQRLGRPLRHVHQVVAGLLSDGLRRNISDTENIRSGFVEIFRFIFVVVLEAGEAVERDVQNGAHDDRVVQEEDDGRRLRIFHQGEWVNI